MSASTSRPTGSGDRETRTKNPTVMLICSHGGHLTELLALADAFAGWKAIWVSHKAQQTENLPNVRFVPHLGESLTGAFLTMVAASAVALFLLLKERPAAVVSTGAELAVPFCWLGRIVGSKVVFVESLTRVRSKSGTGRLVYPIADKFYVQWAQLVHLYGEKAEFAGRVV